MIYFPCFLPGELQLIATRSILCLGHVAQVRVLRIAEFQCLAVCWLLHTAAEGRTPSPASTSAARSGTAPAASTPRARGIITARWPCVSWPPSRRRSSGRYDPAEPPVRLGVGFKAPLLGLIAPLYSGVRGGE